MGISSTGSGISNELKKWLTQQTAYVFDPVRWAHDMLGFECDTWQVEALNDLIEKRFCAWSAGTGVGKSAALAIVILWFMSTRPFPKVPCTAPTQHQLFDVLWGEIAKWLRRNEMLSQMFKWTQTKVSLKGHEEEWFAVARTSKPKPGEQSAEGLQGFHADHILFVLDEGSAVPDQVYNAVDGAFTTDGSYAIVASNPTRRTGYFYNIFNDPRQKGLWALRYIDANKAKSVTPASIERIIKIYGKDHDYYRMKVLGTFPLNDATALFADYQVTEAHGRDLRFGEDDVVGISCDPARFGDDYTVFYIRKGCRIIDRFQLKSMDTMEVAKFGLDLFFTYRPSYYIIDVIGIGAGVVDRTKEELRKPENGKGKDVGKIIEVAVNGTPVDEEKFYNIRAEMFWHLHDIIDTLSIEKETPLLDEELPQIQYFWSRGESLIQIVPKKDLKDILGRSPNDADALALLFYPDVKKAVPLSKDALQIGAASTSKIRKRVDLDDLGEEATLKVAPIGARRYAPLISTASFHGAHESSRGLGWARKI
jgi:phage terminase large subunit